jgi:hypothetical protein
VGALLRRLVPYFFSPAFRSSLVLLGLGLVLEFAAFFSAAASFWALV